MSQIIKLFCDSKIKHVGRQGNEDYSNRLQFPGAAEGELLLLFPVQVVFHHLKSQTGSDKKPVTRPTYHRFRGKQTFTRSAACTHFSAAFASFPLDMLSLPTPVCAQELRRTRGTLTHRMHSRPLHTVGQSVQTGCTERTAHFSAASIQGKELRGDGTRPPVRSQL